MSQRFFVHHPITATRLELDGPEAHHLLHVMRAQMGDRVVLFDGSGAEFAAVIDGIGRKQVSLRVETRHEVDRELPVPLVLAVALPRGDRQEWLVEKAVELGVSRLIPWQTHRSVARPNDNSIERLQRTVVEASKQCGRNRLMEIEPPCEFKHYVARACQGPSLLAHPYVEHLEHDTPLSGEPDAPDRRAIAQGVRMGIGPEGGFTEAEVEQAIAAGWQPIRLGPRILRTETAVLALAAYVGMHLEVGSW